MDKEPRYGLPYLEGSDLAKDIPENSQALAIQLAEVLSKYPVVPEAAQLAQLSARIDQVGVTPQMFGAVADGRDCTKPIQQAIDSVSAAGGGVVYFPAGVYGFDGFKGSQPAWNNSIRGGFTLPAKVKLVGAGKRLSTLLNLANNFTQAISIRGGSGQEIHDLTIDMDYPNRTAASLSFSSTRGEGIIFWNGISPVSDVLIQNVHVQNTGHYGIGVQNVPVTRLQIDGCSFLNIGGDAIDIKDWPQYPKIAITINDCEADTVGLRATVAETEQDAAAFDLRGDVLATNLRVRNLNSYLDPGENAPMIGVCGIRVNGNVDSNEGRLGGRKARVVGGSVISNKAAGEGSESAQRVIGVRVGDSYASVSDVVVENCFVGFRVVVTGDSTPLGAFLDGCHAINCKGAGAAGQGFSVSGSAITNATVSGTAIGCDIGLQSNAVGTSGRISFLNNTVDHNLDEATLSKSQFLFASPANIKASAINRPSPANFYQEATIWNDSQPTLRLRSTKDGAWTTPYDDGGITFEAADVSGAGAGIRAAVRARHTGATAGGTNVVVQANDGTTGLVDVVTLNASRPFWRLASIPAAATDAAAAALSPAVPIGGMYRNGSVLMIRAA